MRQLFSLKRAGIAEYLKVFQYLSRDFPSWRRNPSANGSSDLQIGHYTGKPKAVEDLMYLGSIQ
jgi:hypothetical protein